MLAPIVFPIVFLVQLLPLKKTRDRSAAEVVGYLNDFIEGTGGEWDWDDFTSVPIADPVLEAIRVEAASIALPANDAESTKLCQLLDRAIKIRWERRGPK